MKKIMICPFCNSIVKRDMEECPTCHATREIMTREIEKRKNNEKSEADNNVTEKKSQQDVEDIQEMTEEEKLMREKEQNAEIVKKNGHNMSQDVDGKIEIKTDDVTLLPKTYSIKEARGDMPEKPKWWEIYKRADQRLARRKIMKEVNREGREYPEGIKKWKLIIFCILLGYAGIYHFYAGNRKRGLWHLGIFIFALIVTNLPWKFMAEWGLDWFIGGFAGFVAVFWWFWDLINIVTNRYVFDESRDKFIAKLNYNTRSKLGKKYINVKKGKK